MISIICLAGSLQNHVYTPCRERPPVLRDHKIWWSLYTDFTVTTITYASHYPHYPVNPEQVVNTNMCNKHKPILPGDLTWSAQSLLEQIMVNVMLISKFNTIVPDTCPIDHLKQGWDLTATLPPKNVCTWILWHANPFRTTDGPILKSIAPQNLLLKWLKLLLVPQKTEKKNYHR